MLQRSDRAPDSTPLLSRQPRSHRRPYRNRQRDNAVARAFMGARLWMGLPVTTDTKTEAAQLVGSSSTYVAAAATVIESEIPGLINRVLQGQVSLLAAAASVRKRTRLMKAYRAADQDDRKALGKTIGVDTAFDEIILPSL